MPSPSISKIKYREVNDKIEQISKIIDLITVKVSMIVTVAPFLIMTLIYYVFYDLGDETFQDLFIE